MIGLELRATSLTPPTFIRARATRYTCPGSKRTTRWLQSGPNRNSVPGHFEPANDKQTRGQGKTDYRKRKKLPAMWRVPPKWLPSFAMR